MEADINSIREEILKEKQRIKAASPINNHRISLIEATRCYDYWFCLASYVLSPEDENYVADYHTFKLVATGSWDAVNLFIDKSINNPGVPFFPTNKNHMSWANSTMLKLAHLGLISRYLDLSAQGLLNLYKKNDVFYFEHATPYPGIEGLAVADFKWWQAQQDVSELEESRLETLMPIVEGQISNCTGVYKKHFIKYTSTKEMDEAYGILGRHQRIVHVGSDAFPSNARFGDLSYGEIVQIMEALMGYALKHKDHCLTMLAKHSSINPWNIFTTAERLDDMAQRISDHKSIDYDHTFKFLQLFSATELNSSILGDASGNSTAPLIKASKDHVLQSMGGALGNPFTFLLRSLKHNYERDFFTAVNEREKPFKAELYDLFPSTIFRCDQNIALKHDGKLLTDIDAFLYDSQSKILLLIQLKWMDDFGTSMKGRMSMGSNFYQSSIKWIDAVSTWLNLNSLESLVRKAGLNVSEEHIKEARAELLIIGRNFSHFSDREEDPRGIWCSWYGLARTLSESPSCAENFEALLTKLRARRADHSTLPQIPDTELRLGKHKFIITFKKSP